MAEVGMHFDQKEEGMGSKQTKAELQAEVDKLRQEVRELSMCLDNSALQWEQREKREKHDPMQAEKLLQAEAALRTAHEQIRQMSATRAAIAEQLEHERARCTLLREQILEYREWRMLLKAVVDQ